MVLLSGFRQGCLMLPRAIPEDEDVQTAVKGEDCAVGGVLQV